MTLRQIGSVVTTVDTWDPRKAPTGQSLTYIDISAVDQKTKRVVGAKVILAAGAPSRARQIVAAGDVLVSTVRPNLNGVARVPRELAGATASTGFCVLRPSARVDSSYLFHWVRSPEFIAEMTKKASGQAYPAVSDRIIRDSQLPVPELSEQRRIAEALDRADALRAKRRVATALLDEVAQSLFLDMFGAPAANPNAWPSGKLVDLVSPGDRINYGVVQPGADTESGVPLVRVGDIAQGRVDRAALKRIDREIESRYKRSRLRGDEVLVGCVGSIGTIALAEKSDAGCNIARAVARVPVSPGVDRRYVAEYLRTPYVQNYFTRELRTVAQPTLNIKQLSDTPIFVPPLERQVEFSTRVLAIDSLKELQASHGAALDTLFASVQHRAFRGELRPPRQTVLTGRG